MILVVMFCVLRIEGSFDLCLCRKLAVYDEWSGMTIHVAMDNTVITEDISKWQQFTCISEKQTFSYA